MSFVTVMLKSPFNHCNWIWGLWVGALPLEVQQTSTSDHIRLSKPYHSSSHH